MSVRHKSVVLTRDLLYPEIHCGVGQFQCRQWYIWNRSPCSHQRFPPPWLQLAINIIRFKCERRPRMGRRSGSEAALTAKSTPSDTLTSSHTSQGKGADVVNRVPHKNIVRHTCIVAGRGYLFLVQGGVREEEFLAAVETGLNLMTCSEEGKQDTRMPIVGALGRPVWGQNLTAEETKALTGLRRDRSIVILSSDKGRSTVVMDKGDYEEKAATLLQDKNTYEVVPADPTAMLQRKVEGEFKKLKEVHKEGLPLRPIIAFRGSPTYNLARDLAKRLRQVVESSERMLSNSVDYVERLRGINMGEDDCLVSFDVKAMFTSLPQGLIRQAAMSTVESSREFLEKEKLTTKELIGIVDLCLDSTFFKFRDKIYHQKVGTPMGSPISVVLAEMAMQRYEEEILQDASPSLKLWVRFVDDVFVIMEKEEVESFFELLNGKNEANQFEMEKEENGRLPFLDVMVTRSGATLTTGVYRKDTHADRLLDYNSCHPAAHKRSVVKTLWSRIEKVCSRDDNRRKERSHLKNVFRDNGYPNLVVKRWTARQSNVKIDERQPDAPRVTVSYLKGVSEVAARLPRKHGIDVAHKPRNTLHGALTKVKDTESQADRIGVVYDVRCKDCETH
ncbi:uncharacterized protein LOC143026083 [Oratosquilla oratoria]|uniref:uncharacterized protein LOC143026083 n=1 Tax=Oratosquilla oratoria TaxID=337810 RepID=UPI003F75C969